MPAPSIRKPQIQALRWPLSGIQVSKGLLVLAEMHPVRTRQQNHPDFRVVRTGDPVGNLDRAANADRVNVRQSGCSILTSFYTMLYISCETPRQNTIKLLTIRLPASGSRLNPASMAITLKSNIMSPTVRKARAQEQKRPARVPAMHPHTAWA